MNAEPQMFPNAGTNLYYEVHGSGTPLLLIAGLGSDSQSWLSVLELLADSFKIILLDNRGAGRTTPMDTPATIHQMANDAIALLDHLNIPSAHILGHSMGGMIAQVCASAHPERVDRLILAATATKLTPRDKALIQDWAVTRASGMDLKIWFRNLFYWIFSPAFFENEQLVEDALEYAVSYPYLQSAAGFVSQASALQQADTANELRNIEADILLLQGQYDILFPSAQNADGFDALSNLTVQIIREAAHSIHMEQPVLFAEAVIRFLQGTR